MSTTISTPKSGFRFSLRGMMLLIVVIAVPLTWVGRNFEVARQEEAAATALRKFGWRVTYGGGPGPPGPLEWRHISVVWTSGSSQTDEAGLVHLKELPYLTVLDVTWTNVTDVGLVHLKHLTQLEILDISYTAVTDAGLLHLEGLKELHSLTLTKTQVTDAGVQRLQKALPELSIRR